ncbi:hypothetical protein HK096_000905, partial [Nowakowskiella sp. JEL0078]
ILGPIGHRRRKKDEDDVIAKAIKDSESKMNSSIKRKATSSLNLENTDEISKRPAKSRKDKKGKDSITIDPKKPSIDLTETIFNKDHIENLQIIMNSSELNDESLESHQKLDTSEIPANATFDEESEFH